MWAEGAEDVKNLGGSQVKHQVKEGQGAEWGEAPLTS